MKNKIEALYIFKISVNEIWIYVLAGTTVCNS